MQDSISFISNSGDLILIVGFIRLLFISCITLVSISSNTLTGIYPSLKFNNPLSSNIACNSLPVYSLLLV
jgi:hypothetical protein